VKTISLKKVAVVAVASLGFGLLSVVPAQAVTTVAMVEGITLVNTTTAPVIGTAVVINMGAAIGNVTGAADDDTIRFTGYLSDYPAGGFATVAANATAVGLDGELAGVTAAVGVQANTTEAGASTNFTVTLGTAAALTDNNPVAEGNIVASATQGAARFTFTPTKSGVHVMRVWFDQDEDGVVDATEAVQSVSITVAAPSGFSTGGTTALSAGGVADTLSTVTTNALPYAAAQTLGTKVGSILINIRDTDGALYTGQTVTASVTGPGFVGSAGVSAVLTGGAPTAAQQDTADGTATTTRTASLTDTTGYVAFGVWGDGTAGATSVAISVTDQVSGATTVIATKTFTFFGAVTKLEIVKSNFKIGKAGSTTGALDANLAARNVAGEVTNAGALNALATTPSIIVKATDSGGRVANSAAVPAIVSSNGNVVSGGTCVLDNGADVTYSSGGTGFYNCNFDTASSAASASAAKLTFRITDPADATLFITTATSHDVTVGGSVSTETITFDKTAYAPGEAMVVTRTAKDSAGNPVADGTAAPALTFTKAVGGTAPGASTYVAGTKATSSTAPTVFAPAIAGAFSVTATSGATGSPAITASSSVTDANAGLLTQIDALNAKIVALNALIAKIMKKLGVK
jgi:trimeric autotransporter adhesin